MPLDVPDRNALPDGPQRNLVIELHRLYRDAGYPGLKRLSAEIRGRADLPDVVSHETVSNMLHGQGLSRWIKLECVVRVLAGWSVHRPSVDDEVRRIQKLWHTAADTSPIDGHPAAHETPVGLIVEHEIARVSYVGRTYHCTIRRQLFNGLNEPVTRFPISIRVDRYPDDSARSNRHHGEHPLNFDDVDLHASCDGEPMRSKMFLDTPVLKEVWLLFENAENRFPLYPNRRAEISYSWNVSDELWGHWFQRSIQLQTRRLTLEAEFPTALHPSVWGVRSSMWHDEIPRSPITQRTSAPGRATFTWQTEELGLRDRYRLEWRFRKQPG
ncbi:hypothetical protein Dvina_34600 [Dactylosporangium vinaceum]|nr:hypothetical protein [Dactylosporangium vinaceum]UAB93366.1 hypothetical protein Dvina_34600 [Dactylosporangium vinaceum]